MLKEEGRRDRKAESRLMYEANSQDEWRVMQAAELQVKEHADVLAQELDGLALMPPAGEDPTEQWKARCVAAMSIDGEEFVEKPYRTLEQIMDELLAGKPTLRDMRDKFDDNWWEVPTRQAELYGMLVVDGSTRRHLDAAKIVPHFLLSTGRIFKDSYYVVPGGQATSLIVKLDPQTQLWAKESKDVLEQELKAITSDALCSALGLERSRGTPDCLSDNGWLGNVVSCFKTELYGRSFLEHLDAEPTFELTAFLGGRGLRATPGSRVEVIQLMPEMCVSLCTDWYLPEDGKPLWKRVEARGGPFHSMEWLTAGPGRFPRGFPRMRRTRWTSRTSSTDSRPTSSTTAPAT